MSIAALLCALSCTREVLYTPEDAEDKLILNAQIDASAEHHMAWIGISKTSTIAKVPDATLTCSVNGKDVSMGVLDESLSERSVQSCYQFDAELHPGDIVRLAAKGAGLSAYAEVSVPDTTGRMLAVDTLRTDSGMRFTAHVRDYATDRNYYRIRLVTKTSQTYLYSGEWSSWEDHALEVAVTHKNDPILDGRIGSSEGDDFFGLGSSSNLHCIFTDRLFAEGNADIIFTVDDRELSRVYVNRYYDQLRATCSASVSLISMDLAEYEYLNIQNILYDNGYDASDLLEPVTVPTNVVDGTGFVGIFMPSTVDVKLPDISLQRGGYFF